MLFLFRLLSLRSFSQLLKITILHRLYVGFLDFSAQLQNWINEKRIFHPVDNVNLNTKIVHSFRNVNVVLIYQYFPINIFVLSILGYAIYFLQHLADYKHFSCLIDFYILPFGFHFIFSADLFTTRGPRL